jgi:hypothetical protein
MRFRRASFQTEESNGHALAYHCALAVVRRRRLLGSRSLLVNQPELGVPPGFLFALCTRQKKILFDREDGECSHHEKTFAIDSNSDFGCSNTAIKCRCAGTEAASAGKSSARRAWASGTSGPCSTRRAATSGSAKGSRAATSHSSHASGHATHATTSASAKGCRSATRPAKSRSANAPGRAAHAATSGSAKGSRAATHPATSNSSNASGHTTHR